MRRRDVAVRVGDDAATPAPVVMTERKLARFERSVHLCDDPERSAHEHGERFPVVVRDREELAGRSVQISLDATCARSARQPARVVVLERSDRDCIAQNLAQVPCVIVTVRPLAACIAAIREAPERVVVEGGAAAVRVDRMQDTVGRVERERSSACSHDVVALVVAVTLFAGAYQSPESVVLEIALAVRGDRAVLCVRERLNERLLGVLREFGAERAARGVAACQRHYAVGKRHPARPRSGIERVANPSTSSDADLGRSTVGVPAIRQRLVAARKRNGQRSAIRVVFEPRFDANAGARLPDGRDAPGPIVFVPSLDRRGACGRKTSAFVVAVCGAPRVAGILANKLAGVVIIEPMRDPAIGNRLQRAVVAVDKRDRSPVRLRRCDQAALLVVRKPRRAGGIVDPNEVAVLIVPVGASGSARLTNRSYEPAAEFGLALRRLSAEARLDLGQRFARRAFAPRFELYHKPTEAGEGTPPPSGMAAIIASNAVRTRSSSLLKLASRFVSVFRR